MDAEYTTYCTNCDKMTEYYVLHRISPFTIKDVGFVYIEQTPICKECEHEVYVSEIYDANCDAREREYLKKIQMLKGERNEQ